MADLNFGSYGPFYPSSTTVGGLSNFGTSMASAGLGTLMDFGTNLISSFVNQAFYKRNLNAQVAAQKELIDYQNAYNSPSAQMQRLEEAGLNPHLVYGSQAPAGQSGNASAPAGAAPQGASFHTADVVASMLRMKQMEQNEAQINLLNAQAENQREQARYTAVQSTRYNEIINVQLAQAEKGIEEAASRIGLNRSSIQLQYSQKLLNDANRLYQNGEIGLQQYRKQYLIAQTQLYRSDASLKKANEGYLNQMTSNAQVENLILRIQERYERIMKDPDTAEKSRKAQLQLLENDARRSAASIGIEGSKFIQWYNFVCDHAEQTSRMLKNVRH